MMVNFYTKAVLSEWLCFFIFLTVLLPNKTLCKPFELEAPREDFAHYKLEPNVAYQNNITDVRSKREVKTLRDICNAGDYGISSNGCVKRWLICYDYQEAECNAVSFKCLSSIPRCGSPKCRPIYDFVEVSLSGAVQKFRRTKNSFCDRNIQTVDYVKNSPETLTLADIQKVIFVREYSKGTEERSWFTILSKLSRENRAFQFVNTVINLNKSFSLFVTVTVGPCCCCF
ncbi:unnamed protein product [Pocillopora meandrina]|uniref:Uncharacterized protein n=1 Tax=Pocillopora meandrina TaxID=46732 RepID=A0AAU9X6T1_9CNID|nr:unnamed protein product [Pocillopora meandrina]